MKNIVLFRIFSIIIFNVMVMTVFALTGPFEGIIIYKVTYPESKLTENIMTMLPKVLTITIKSDMAKSEIETPMGAQIEIINYTDETKISLINILNQNFALRETAAEIWEAKKNEPKGVVQISNETKIIAGFTCTKAIVTVDDNGIKVKIDVWFTQELGGKNVNFDKPMFKDIPGVLLEFSMISPNFTMMFTAISVEKVNIPSQEFDIPSDYLLTTKAEMKTKLVLNP